MKNIISLLLLYGCNIIACDKPLTEVASCKLVKTAYLKAYVGLYHNHGFDFPRKTAEASEQGYIPELFTNEKAMTCGAGCFPTQDKLTVIVTHGKHGSIRVFAERGNYEHIKKSYKDEQLPDAQNVFNFYQLDH